MLEKLRGKEKLGAFIASFVALISTFIPIFRLSYPDLAGSLFSASFRYKNLGLCLWNFATGALSKSFENINSISSFQFDVPPALIVLQLVSVIVLLGIISSIASLFLKNKKSRTLSLGLLSASFLISIIMIIAVFTYVQSLLSKPEFMGIADMVFKFVLQFGAFLLPFSLGIAAFLVYRSDFSKEEDILYEPPAFCTDCGKRLYGGEKCDCTKTEPEPDPEPQHWVICPFCEKKLHYGETCDCSTYSGKRYKSTMKCRRCGKRLGTCDCPPPEPEPAKRIENEHFEKAGDL